jgi:hypothetical protein
MRAKYWLIGYALCIAGTGNAAATSLDNHDLDNSTHTTADCNGSHDGNGSSGSDALGLARDGTQHGTVNDGSSSTTPGNSSDHSGGGAVPAPARSHQPHLGWQSLLPGSIQ